MRRVASHPTVRPEPVEGSGRTGSCVCHRPISPNGESLLALPKSNQKASPCTPLLPPVLATGGMRQRHTKASLALRTVCADDASTTARCSAPRRGLKGRLVRKQLFAESLIQLGLKRKNRHLSTSGVFSKLAHIEWRLREKDACVLDAANCLPGSREAHVADIKFGFVKLTDLDAGARAKVGFLDDFGAALRSRPIWI